MSRSTVLHLVQDLPTPHNNVLIAALDRRPELELRLWYAMSALSALPWKTRVGALDGRTVFLSSVGAKWNFVLRFLRSKEDVFLFVGYSSFATRIGLLLSWLLRRRSLYWTDNPRHSDHSALRRALRRIALALVRKTSSTVFVVGQGTVDVFRAMRFRESQIQNLPIFVELPDAETVSTARRSARSTYCEDEKQVLFISGSRLVFSKGYDLLIEAVSTLSERSREIIRLVIVGSGPEAARLDAMISEKHLSRTIRREEWLEPGEYDQVVRGADVFVHPARFDAFGGGTLLAMAAGVPVIGSRGAGTVVDRIIDGVSGFVYDAEDTSLLGKTIDRLAHHRELREQLGRQGRQTASQWPPESGAAMIVAAVQKAKGRLS